MTPPRSSPSATSATPAPSTKRARPGARRRTGDMKRVCRTGATRLVVYRPDFAGTNRANAAVWGVGDELDRSSPRWRPRISLRTLSRHWQAGRQRHVASARLAGSRIPTATSCTSTRCKLEPPSRSMLLSKSWRNGRNALSPDGDWHEPWPAGRRSRTRLTSRNQSVAAMSLAQPAGGVMTAQATRAPLLPLGSVTWSSALAWMTKADPSASASAARLAPDRTSDSLTAPLAATDRLGRSPACDPCGLLSPCWRCAGFQCTPRW